MGSCISKKIKKINCEDVAPAAYLKFRKAFLECVKVENPHAYVYTEVREWSPKQYYESIRIAIQKDFPPEDFDYDGIGAASAIYIMMRYCRVYPHLRSTISFFFTKETFFFDKTRIDSNVVRSGSLLDDFLKDVFENGKQRMKIDLSDKKIVLDEEKYEKLIVKGFPLEKLYHDCNLDNDDYFWAENVREESRKRLFEASPILS